MVIYKRNSALIYILEVLETLKNLGVLFILFLAVCKISVVNSIIIIGILFIIINIFLIIRWRNEVFFIREGMLHHKKGVFIKKEFKTSLSSITTINIEETITQRIFKVQTLKIDTKDLNAGSEFEIVLGRKSLKTFKDALKVDLHNLNKKTEEKDYIGAYKDEVSCNKEELYYLNNKNLVKFSLLNSNKIFIIGAFFSILFFVSEVVERYNLNKFINNENIFNNKTWVVLIFIGIIVMLKLLGAIILYLRYKNFVVVRNKNQIDISYGFITKKNYSVNLENIYAVKINQNIGQRMFKVLTLSINTCGYGDDKDEDAVIFPVIRESEINEKFQQLFNEFIYHGTVYKIHEKYKFRHEKTFIGYDENIICISKGIIGKKQSFIKLKYVDYIKLKQNYFQRKNNLIKLKFDYKGKSIGDISSIRGIKEKHFRGLEEII